MSKRPLEIYLESRKDRQRQINHQEDELEEGEISGENLSEAESIRLDSPNEDPIESVNEDPIESVNEDPIESVNEDPIESVNEDPINSSAESLMEDLSNFPEEFRSISAVCSDEEFRKYLSNLRARHLQGKIVVLANGSKRCAHGANCPRLMNFKCFGYHSKAEIDYAIQKMIERKNNFYLAKEKMWLSIINRKKREAKHSNFVITKLQQELSQFQQRNRELESGLKEQYDFLSSLLSSGQIMNLS